MEQSNQKWSSEIFEKQLLKNFTCFILEYLVPYTSMNLTTVLIRTIQ